VRIKKQPGKSRGGKVWQFAAAGALLVLAALFFLGVNSSPAVKVYFIKGERLESVKRVLPEGGDRLQIAAAELISGPNAQEQAGGIFSEIPSGTKILKAEIIDKVAAITFNKKISDASGGSARIQGMIAQIVYTFTEIPGVEKVKIEAEGEESLVLGGEGYVVDQPLSREEIKF
jgi:spore germination protein GerM